MAKTIRGVTIKIGADTSDFIKELKKVDKEINATQRTANELQKGLQLEFDSNRFVQAQKQVQSALDTTEAKAKAIREQMEYLQKTGGGDSANYQKLETELAKTETRAIQLRQQLEAIDNIKFQNLNKDLFENIDKSSKAVAQSSKNVQELTNKLKDSSIYGKALKDVQEQTQKQLKKSNKEIKEMAQYLKQAKEQGVPVEDIEQLEIQLEEARFEATLLEEALEKSTKVDIDRLNNQIKNVSKNLETAAKKTAVLSAAAVGAIAGVWKLGSDAATTGANLQDMADRLDISAEALQRYDYIALQSGVETEQLVKSIAKARDAVGTALAGGTNTASKALQTLFGDLSQIPTGTEEAFTAIIEKLSQVEDSTMQAYYANEIFGERLATNLIPLINNGADRLAQLGEEFESIGYLSNEQVQALADFDDELNIMKERLSLAKTELGIAMLPIMEQFADILSNVVVPAIKSLSEWFGNLPEPMQKVITFGLLLVAALSPVLFIMSKIIGVIPSLVKMFGALKSAFGIATIGVTSFLGALGLVFDLVANWSQMSALEKVLKVIAIAFLTAAAAAAVFHSTWSLGFAVAGIVAAVAGGIAAINSAGKSIGIDPNFTDQGSVESAANSLGTIPTSSGSGSTYNEDNSQYNININMDATGNLNYDAEELANAVIKKIVVAKQSSGR